MSAVASFAEAVSPELVLVDPSLAARVRVSLDLDEPRGLPTDETVEWSAKQTAAALRRIDELAKEDERLKRGSEYRVAKLTGALATWAIVAILAADMQLWRLGAM
jgi:hypothetical protein